MDSLAGRAEGVRAAEQIRALIKPLTQCLVKSYLSNEIQLPEIRALLQYTENWQGDHQQMAGSQAGGAAGRGSGCHII